MLTLAEFFEQAENVVIVAPLSLLDEDGLRDATERMQPLMQQRAERAGVDLAELEEEIRERVDTAVRVIVARIMQGADVITEMRGLGSTAAVHHFLLGVLWEQARQLPDIGGPTQ